MGIMLPSRFRSYLVHHTMRSEYVHIYPHLILSVYVLSESDIEVPLVLTVCVTAEMYFVRTYPHLFFSI